MMHIKDGSGLVAVYRWFLVPNWRSVSIQSSVLGHKHYLSGPIRRPGSWLAERSFETDLRSTF